MTIKSGCTLMRFLYLIIMISSLCSCKSKNIDDELIIPAEQLYNESVLLLNKTKYSKAADGFGQIFLQHPGNPITPQAELMHAYSLFRAAQYDEAADVLDIFIKLHPMNIDIAYAYYLKALSYYMQISNIELDQSRTKLAKISLEDVITRFAGSKYAIDAALKIDLVNDHLAAKEMDIGRYYLHTRNPIAAIPRFQNVIQQYQTTAHTAECLYRLVVSFTSLGLRDEAKKYAAVLGYNYPESNWYKYAYSLMHKHKE